MGEGHAVTSSEIRHIHEFVSTSLGSPYFYFIQDYHVYSMVDSTSHRPMHVSLSSGLHSPHPPVPAIFAALDPGTQVKALPIIFQAPLLTSFPLVVLTLFSEPRLGLPQCLLNHHAPHSNSTLTDNVVPNIPFCHD